MPAEAERKLSPGDTRQQVRSLLGHPLIDSQRLGVEVYQLTGRDTDVLWGPPYIPIPFPGNKVRAVMLVVYDDRNIVKDIASGLWEYGYKGGERVLAGTKFWISAGGFSFANLVPHSPPDTLVGPPIAPEELTTAPITGDKCALILLVTDCPMQKTSLDNSLIANFFPAHCYPGKPLISKYDSIYGMFIRKEIVPGRHVLSVHQRFPYGEFEKTFVCSQGETLYAQLEAQIIVKDRLSWGGKYQLEGSIMLNKSAPRSIVKDNKLRPILWHKGLWYVRPN